MFTLDQIRSFVAVAEELHFGRAAHRLNMTQPPLSRQIQKLEKTVGARLIERDNRKASLTPAGRAFLEEARRLLATAQQAPVTARRVARGQAGLLRVGFTAASGFSLLGELLATAHEKLPEVEIDLREMVTREQLSALSAEEVDIALARPPVDQEQFASRLLQAEPLRLAVPAAHPLAALERPVREPDLTDVPLILHSPTKARYFYDLAIRHMPVQHGNAAHTVSQIVTMVSLVAAGHGVAFVPESAARISPPGVVLLPLESDAEAAVELHAIWRHGHQNPALYRLLQALETDPHSDALEAPLSRTELDAHA